MSPNFEGVYTVSAFEEGEAVEGRIAAGVEDEPAPWKFCREPPVQRRHVDPGGVRDIPRGMPAVITNRVGHPLWCPRHQVQGRGWIRG